MSRRLNMRHLLVTAAIGTLLLFQNCSAPPEDASFSTSSSYENRLPLAVEGQVDTIGYMSCSEMPNDPEPRAYFSFRALAFKNSTGGLRVSREYLEKTRYFSNTDRARSFANSEANGDTRFSLSIRSAANYQSIWKAEELRVGKAIEGLMSPLDSNQVSGQLASAVKDVNSLLNTPMNVRDPNAGIPWTNYFPGSETKRLIEGSLRFYKLDDDAVKTRNALETRQSLLVAGFSAGADELNTSLRVPPSVTAAPGYPPPVYGRGYYLRFGLPSGYQSGEKRVLASGLGPAAGVEEVDLSQSQPTPVSGTWDCSSTYQFQVVRPEDAVTTSPNYVPCARAADPVNMPAQLQAIRRVLRVEDWYVDLAGRCVVPKNSGDYCYGNNIQNRRIQYGSPNCTNSTTTLCPHFVSVCIRQ